MVVSSQEQMAANPPLVELGRILDCCLMFLPSAGLPETKTHTEGENFNFLSLVCKEKTAALVCTV